MLTYFCVMMNKQLAFVKSGLGLALCFLMVGAGVTPPIHASNANVSISQQAKKVPATVTDAKGETLLGVNVVEKVLQTVRLPTLTVSIPWKLSPPPF